MKKKKREIARSATPSVFTIGNGCFGFLAILAIVSNKTDTAVILIFSALFLDFLDGLIARRLDVTSPFGLELDSLADTISFVVVPALMISFLHLKGLSGALLGIIAIACGIIRLAKFNVSEVPGFYTGISTPLFAVLVIAVTIVGGEISEPILISIFLLLSLSMVSPFRYPSFRSKKLSKYKWLSFFVLVIMSYSIFYLKLPHSQLYILEHALIWIFLFIPSMFEPTSHRWRQVVFFGGMLLGLALFSGMYDLLLLYPIFYLILGAPFIFPTLETI